MLRVLLGVCSSRLVYTTLSSLDQTVYPYLLFLGARHDLLAMRPTYLLVHLSVLLITSALARMLLLTVLIRYFEYMYATCVIKASYVMTEL